jgi:ubiquinone/menaquinone biosynthesis C-methylase UbiE
MVDLKRFYNERVNETSQSDYLKQVGHTVNGTAISHQSFELLISNITENLELNSDDKLLDLCCGNGVITARLAQYCETIQGIDLSDELINIANLSQLHSEKISFITGDIMQLDDILDDNRGYSKVLMFGALQHFERNQLTELLDITIKFCAPEFTLLLGFIPNISKRWRFYDTLNKKLLYLYRKLVKTDVMGTWWDKQYIFDICEQRQLKCEFLDVEVGEYGYPYRFHAVIKKSV